MTQFGAHAFIWRAEWTPESAAAVVAAVADAGLDFVEIPLLRPAEFDAAATRALLERHGVGATCSLGLPAGAAFPDEPEAAERFLTDAVARVAAVGSPTLTGVLFGTLGVSLGVEPVNRYESILVNTGDQALDLIARIDEPNVFLHLDTYHMNIEKRGFREPIERAGDRLRYIYLSESDRATPGRGNVGWNGVFRGWRRSATKARW